MMDPRRRRNRNEIAGDADGKSAADPDRREQHAADGGAEHAAGIIGADIQGHRRAHPIRSDDLADHRAANRVVRRPSDAIDKAGERDMPHFERVAPGQQRQDHRAEQHRNDDKDQRGAALEPLGHSADDRAEQRHRQHPQHCQQRDNEWRAGALISEHGDRQHLQPAHRKDNDTDQPQPAEIGFAEEPGSRRSPNGRDRHGKPAADARRKNGRARSGCFLPTFPPIAIFRLDAAPSAE